MLKNTLEAFSHAVLDKMEKKTRERKRGMEQKTKEKIKRAIRQAAELLFWVGVGTAAFFAIFFLLRYMGVWE